MRLNCRRAAALVVAAGISFSIAAQEEPAAAKFLTPGKGVELATARCVLCHEATHITRTKLSRGEWEFNIKNMIERGAPIAPNEIAPILEYLATYYNRDVAPPAPVAASTVKSVEQLLTANACVACHQVDKKVIGPSFKEVAARYASDSGASGKLAQKIRAGGAGVWGTVPMPPNAGVTDADLQQVVIWILGQK